MGRIIVNIEDGIDNIEALKHVGMVISDGRISDNGKCYCYCTVFKNGPEVYANRTKGGTDVFKVCRGAA